MTGACTFLLDDAALLATARALAPPVTIVTICRAETQWGVETVFESQW